MGEALSYLPESALFLKNSAQKSVILPILSAAF